MRSNGYDDSREISREISPEISREISREIASASGHRLEVRSTAASGQGVYAREPLAAHAAIVAEAPVTVPLESSSERGGEGGGVGGGLGSAACRARTPSIC